MYDIHNIKYLTPFMTMQVKSLVLGKQTLNNKREQELFAVELIKADDRMVMIWSNPSLYILSHHSNVENVIA